jgi:hypothetical protein
MPYFAVFYVLLSIFVAFIGMNRKFGFWGYFFASIALTPLIGILLVLASGKPRLRHRA